MNDIKLIFSDIDRTILPAKGGISPVTRETVRRCREKGVEFVVASGRWYPAARLIANDQLDIQDGYMIICNGGAVVKSDGTPLMEWGMEDAQARAVYEFLKDKGVLMTAYVRNAIYRLHMEKLTSFKLPETGYFHGQTLYLIEDENEEAFVEYGLRHPYKMEAYSDDYELLGRLRTGLEEMGLQVNSSFPCNLEIMARGTGKGAAVRWLTRHMGYERAQTLGFGDYTNDLPMLENVGWPVAVENAVDEVKAVCRSVAPACEDDGVAKFIEEHVLGDEKA